MTSYWFKPHSYGYGATPANWRGWAATGRFWPFCSRLRFFSWHWS